MGIQSYRCCDLTTMTFDLLHNRASNAETGTGTIDVSTGKIREWRSIITLIVFVLTSEYFTFSEGPAKQVE